MPDLRKSPDETYRILLEELKGKVRSAQVKATLRVNRELVLLYWDIGRSILERQAEGGWGAKVIDQLSGDLRETFPGVKGFSSRNLNYMRAFAEAWPDRQFVQQAAAQIPWFHNCTLLDKVKDKETRIFYLQHTVEYGWSRNVLVAQIEGELHMRQAKAQNNFEQTLPALQSDLAHQLLKDPYVFDFLELSADIRERELERALIEHIRAFLLELGVGFAFIGNQVHLDVGGEDFYVDMLFYHLRLRSYVVVELKTGPFKPEYAGKLNFYLSAVDSQLRDEKRDHSTIGLILCKTKNKVIVEYALRGSPKPIGVANWQLTRSLPDDLGSRLPTVQELEEELNEKGKSFSKDEKA